MKTSKKILGVALAIIMIFNVFAIGAFAAFPDDAAIKLIVATADGKSTYAPGDEITFAVSFQSTEEVGKLSSYGQHQFAYNSSVLELYNTTVDATAGIVKMSAQGLALDASQTAGFVENNSPISITGGEISDNSYGWDTAVQHVLYVDGGYVDTVSGPYQFYTFKMKIAEDATDGEYVFGFNEAAYVNWEGYVSAENNPEVYAEAYDYSTDTFEYGTCTFTVSSAPAVTVESKGTMAHMNNWEDTAATTYTAGLVGQINGLALTFDETTGECNEIKEIKVTIEGSDDVGYAYQVYKVNDTAYQFRAILLNAPKTGTTALNYTFHVTLADGSTVTCSDSTTAKEIFDAAYARYEAAKNA